MSCKPKKEFWKAILFRNNIPQERFKNIWPIISFNRNTKPKKDSLILIGNIINIIWQHHWNSIFEERMWRTDWALTTWLHFNTHNSNNIAAHTKREFDKKYDPTWHCVVGRNFGSFVTHESKYFIYFYHGPIAILLFKST
ncbi:unnamed protein product [Cunninghamella echinulata]